VLLFHFTSFQQTTNKQTNKQQDQPTMNCFQQLTGRRMMQFWIHQASSTPYRHHINNNNNNHHLIQQRYKHSSTQIKRLFKRNPAKRRIALRQQRQQPGGEETSFVVVPQPRLEPLTSNPPPILPNGWNPPLLDVEIPKDYPFHVSRTKNKPNDAVGFLPVYSEFR
jgi:hypothetical protein